MSTQRELNQIKSVTLVDVQDAATRINDAILRTPCPPSPALSDLTGSSIFCKLEYLQRTGSFKERGARNALLLLSPEQRLTGVIAASAGNHALGLSWHGRSLSIPVTVVMPKSAPITKIANCRKHNARVLLHGNDIQEARELALRIVKEEGLTYINGFNDAAIIAGQGTIALELIEQVPQFNAIILPVGGGGLAAGIALVLKSIRPDVRIIAAQPGRVGSLKAAMETGSPIPNRIEKTLADGLAVPVLGERAWSILAPLIDEWVEVGEKEIALAILKLIELEKAVVEGAGAVPLAALLTGKLSHLKNQTVVLPLCGGNIDTTTLGRVIERGLAADGRLGRITCTISDRPGGLAEFALVVAVAEGSIIQIEHDRAFASDDLSKVTIHCLVESRDQAHLTEIEAALRKSGFSPEQ
ncbi:MAG: threonine ammonia-lyase [Verrucomicrobiota bacterium]|nr:threonine ammonia-lyase [Verrucomicrobiota bacterium]